MLELAGTAWKDFFVVYATSAAALVGLLFVALLAACRAPLLGSRVAASRTKPCVRHDAFVPAGNGIFNSAKGFRIGDRDRRYQYRDSLLSGLGYLGD